MLKVNRSDFLIKPFLKRNNIRASYQIISTIFPIISIWLIIYHIVIQPFSLLFKGFLLIPFIVLLTLFSSRTFSLLIKAFLLIPFIVLLTLFSSRTFSLMHDCGHNSLFTTRKLNRFFGFLLGLVNGIPQKSWSIDLSLIHI